MRSRALVLLTLALALAVVPHATGATKRPRALQGTIHMAIIGPNGDSGSKFAGEFASMPTGRAALLFQNTIKDGTSTGRAVIYTKHGTIVATATNELQRQTDGSVKLPGTFKITGGTGRFENATGSGAFDGMLPANSTIVEVTANGKIRY